MKSRFFVVLVVAILSTSAAPALSGSPDRAEPAATDHAECSHLTMLKLPDVKVTQSAAVPAATTGGIRVPHCPVTGLIGSAIPFPLLRPHNLYPNSTMA